MNGFEVLGLASCHGGKQVRLVDQTRNPKVTIESFVGHSSMGLLCPPVLKFPRANCKSWLKRTAKKLKILVGNGKQTCKVGPFVSKQKCQISVFLGVYTHTPPAGGRYKNQVFCVEDGGSNLFPSCLMSCPACSA